MARSLKGPIVMLPVRIPAGLVDGAVVELSQSDDGIVTAEIRIPAHQEG